jgi:hypothetical protein
MRKLVTFLLTFLLLSCNDYDVSTSKSISTEINNPSISLKITPKPVDNSLSGNKQNVDVNNKNNIISTTPTINLSVQPTVKPTSINTPVADFSIKPIENLNIRKDFNFQNNSKYKIIVKVLDYEDKAISNIPLSIYLNSDEEENLSEEISSGITNDDGRWEAIITVPSYKKEVFLFNPYIGLPKVTKVNLDNSELNITLKQ